MKKTMLLLLALGAQSQAQEKEKIKIVTTLNVLRHVAEKVGGDRVIAVAVAQPTRDPHTVQADPVMQRQASEADLFIYLGRGLDLWAKDIIQGSGNVKIQTGAGQLLASRDCSVLELPKVLSKEWGDVHPEGNPHVWLDPLNVKTIARNTSGSLSAVDPSGKATYETNLKTFEREIDEAMFGKELVDEEGGEVLWRKLRLGKLDDFLKEEGLESALSGWMKKARSLRGVKFLSYHKTYIYFSERFGFEIAGELEEKPGIAPPARHLEALLDLVKRENVKLILNDVFYARDAADYVAEKTGAKVLVLPIDVGGVRGAESYVRMMDYVLDRMVEGVQ